MDIRATLTHPIGPLPLWGWGAIGAGGAILYAAKRGHPVAQAITDPNTPFPAPPGLTQQPINTSGGGTGTDFPPQVIGPGQQYVQAGAPAVTLADIIGGGSLSDLINNLGPNYQSFGLNAGDVGVDVTHQAQNQIDEATYQAQLAHGENMAVIGNQAAQEQYDAQREAYIAQVQGQQQSSMINYGNQLARKALYQNMPFQYSSGGFNYNPFEPAIYTAPIQ